MDINIASTLIAFWSCIICSAVFSASNKHGRSLMFVGLALLFFIIGRLHEAGILQ